jgi:hypothetical protein
MNTAELLADHYQKTYELTLETWKERNRSFLLLLAVIGTASLLTFNVEQAQPLLGDLIAKIFSITDATRRGELGDSFPYGLIQSILLMVVLYLMVTLCHRTTSINRHYRYLQSLEQELRNLLALGSDSVGFTREGAFYWGERHWALSVVGYAYKGMLGLLLLAFLGMRIYGDVSAGNFLFAVTDTLLAAATLVFFVGYAKPSLGLSTDKKEEAPATAERKVA